MYYIIEEKFQEAASEFSKNDNQEKYGLEVVPLEAALRLLEEFKKRSIIWDVEDFENWARDIESRESEEDFWDTDIDVPEKFKLYDRSKFEQAFLTMIRRHDCTIGITWDTIEFYLDEYCKISTRKI